MTQEELNTILEKHKKWLLTYKSGVRADLCNVNLCGIDLSGADLRNANISYANLCGANLCNADLRDANFRGANLRDANLCNAKLQSADCYCTNFYGANLCNANLRGANLYSADLRNANLCNAHLFDANFRYANLHGADLCNAVNFRNTDIYGADLRNATNIPFIPMACPEEGSFIGFKKVRDNHFIVKLEIPADAKRSSATTRKCRCNKAKVLAIQTLDGTISGIKTVSSCYDPSFIYEVGKTVEVKDFDEDRWNECSTGIHFFINRQDAVDY